MQAEMTRGRRGGCYGDARHGRPGWREDGMESRMAGKEAEGSGERADRVKLADGLSRSGRMGGSVAVCVGRAQADDRGRSAAISWHPYVISFGRLCRRCFLV